MTSRLRRHDNGRVIFYDAWRNIPSFVLRSKDQLASLMAEDFIESKFDISTIKQYKWIIDLKPEGIDANDIQPLYEYLCNDHGLDPNNFRVIFSCQQDVESLPYMARCVPDRLIYNGNWYMHLKHYNVDWYNMPMTHALVCLMRRPSLSRGNLAKRLLAKFKLNQMIMTFGTNGSDPGVDIKRLIWPQPYPIIVDRPMADQVFQHRIDHDFFYRAPLNITVESSSQTDSDTWRSIFITEKTFKTMAWHQFPIWYAVPGLVDAVRRMGFDVFDDLFDHHHYDTIDDPWVRMTTVINLVKKFVSQDVISLRQHHWSRLVANADLVEYIHTTAISKHTEILESMINA